PPQMYQLGPPGDGQRDVHGDASDSARHRHTPSESGPERPHGRTRRTRAGPRDGGVREGKPENPLVPGIAGAVGLLILVIVGMALIGLVVRFLLTGQLP